MSVREPGYDPRRPHPRRDARASGRRPVRLAGALGVLALVLVVAATFGSGLVRGPGGLASPAATASPGAGSGTGTPGSSPSTPGGGPGATSTPAPDPSGGVPGPGDGRAGTDVAIVPVTGFRSPRTGVAAASLRALAAGDPPFRQLVLVETDADAILAALGLSRESLGERLVTVDGAAAVAERLAGRRNRLAFLRADDVGPSVRALAWDGRSLFGVDRVASLEAWPLTVRLPGPGVPAYDPAGAWTLFAGGDILLDRGVKLAIDANGADFPFDGGTVDITGWCRDCSPMGWDLPRTRRTGNAGIVRDLVSGADLAIANFENPAPDAWRWHGRGTVFNADPALVDALVDAGLDWVSLANNHIGDAGRTGMLQTMRNLDRRGLAHGGLGRNSDAAHEATLLEAGGVTVGILAYDQIAPVYTAGADLAGTARMTRKALRRDVRAARAAGADVVIVFPHWGIEYRAAPSAAQQAMGRAAIDAGADMVIGNHPHWAGGMEVYEGRPIWYALGNFVFDQTWSDYTMEGITLELTFRETRLVQVRMRPHLVMDRAQPNLMDPAGQGGAFVMDQVWGASEGLLPW